MSTNDFSAYSCYKLRKNVNVPASSQLTKEVMFHQRYLKFWRRISLRFASIAFNTIYYGTVKVAGTISLLFSILQKDDGGFVEDRESRKDTSKTSSNGDRYKIKAISWEGN